jgi:hypothetical protein
VGGATAEAQRGEKGAEERERERERLDRERRREGEEEILSLAPFLLLSLFDPLSPLRPLRLCGSIPAPFEARRRPRSK